MCIASFPVQQTARKLTEWLRDWDDVPWQQCRSPIWFCHLGGFQKQAMIYCTLNGLYTMQSLCWVCTMAECRWICFGCPFEVVFKGKQKKAPFKPGGGMPEVGDSAFTRFRHWRFGLWKFLKVLPDKLSWQNINARAALISGPPGIGKTTTCGDLRHWKYREYCLLSITGWKWLVSTIHLKYLHSSKSLPSLHISTMIWCRELFLEPSLL